MTGPPYRGMHVELWGRTMTIAMRTALGGRAASVCFGIVHNRFGVGMFVASIAGEYAR